MAKTFQGVINLVKVSDGAAGPAGPAGPAGAGSDSYYIKANQPEIIKYPQPNSSKEEYSPKTLIFSLNLFQDQISLTDWSYSLTFTGLNEEEKTFDNNLTEFLYLDNNLLYFEIDSFMQSNFAAGSDLNLEKDIQEILQEELAFINLVFSRESDNQRVSAQLVVRMRNSKDLAKFGIYANGVTAAIQNTTLNFDANGLLIKNGGIEIQNQNGEAVCYFDDFGNLKIVGSGVFGGRIEATEGSFSGNIDAKSGRFSGVVQVGSSVEGQDLSETILIDGEKRLIKSSNFDNTRGLGFSLNSNGIIEANSIELGRNAYIKEYLQIGDNCFIRNPLYSEGDNSFISILNEGSRVFVLDKNGRISLGDGIVLDGTTSTMKAANNSWSISPKQAVFNNIVAKGTIKTSVFEKGEIQTVSGTFIIRPSTLIASCKKANNYEIYSIIPSNIISDFFVGDCCEIEGQTFFVLQLTRDAQGNITEIFLGKEKESDAWSESLEFSSYSLFTNKVVVNYGKDGDIAIAINSSDSGSALPQRAISVLQTAIKNNEKQLEPKIILGDMTEQNYGGLTGYGLYADNVFLKGQIISESLSKENIDENFYSGIHTSSKVQMPQNFYPNKKIGEILFWAGAKDSTPEAIQAAPFKVDSYGNLYAGSGYFKGSIISEATISAAKIQTAILEGWTTTQGTKEAALTITAENAIDFRNTKDGTSKMNLSATDLSLTIPLKIGAFISIEPKGVIKTEKMEISETILLDKNGLAFQAGDLKSQFSQSSDGLDLEISNEIVARFTSTQAYMTENLQCGKNVYFSNIMEYRQVIKENEIIGYDLYVKE